jgi:copper amine oxidase-like protein
MRRILSLLAASIAVASFAAPAHADAPPTILVDGYAVSTDVPPVVVDEHVLVPLRGVFERFGAAVEYDAASDTAVATRDGTTVKVVDGSPVGWVNGARVALETPAREIAGRLEVPLRFVATALGVSVDYDAGSNTVVIVSGSKPGSFVAAGPGTPSYAPASVASTADYGTSSGAPPTVDGQQPSPNALIGSDYPQIYARLGGGSSAVDPATVRVLIDDVDVTNQSTVSSAYIAYTPSQPMAGGTHTVDVSGQSDDGTPFDSRWSFEIESDMTSGYVASSIGFAPQFFGVPRFGFFPPGFSVFAPGPQFFVFGQPIIIVFFSPFFPNGTGFFSLSGVPGQFVMTPWLGCPGFFWGSFNVPGGVMSPNAVIAAHFTTSDGRTVVAHSTAPLHIDGTRKTIPSSIRFAVRGRLVDHPLTPRTLMAFDRVRSTVPRRDITITMIRPSHVPVRTSIPIARRRMVPLVTGIRQMPARPVMIPRQNIPVARPVMIPQQTPVIIPRPAAPVVIPRKPIPPR